MSASRSSGLSPRLLTVAAALVLPLALHSFLPQAAHASEGPSLEAEPVGPTPIEPPETPETIDKHEANNEPALPETPAPESPSSELSNGTSAGDLTPEQREEILQHPTRNIEDYQKIRGQDYHQRTLPDSAISLIVSPRVYSQLDLRKPAKTGFDQTNPALFGVALGYDHSVLKTPNMGVASLGLDVGFYGSSLSNPYGGLLPGFLTATPHVTYEGVFMPKQWVVPTVRLGADLVRYHYTFENQSISGFKELPRADLGAMIYLNLLEPDSAANMQGNYNIKRTYLGAFFTLEADSSQKDFNMTDHSFRIVLRFEQ